jgi:biotin carboxyl carrier protein
MQNKTEIKRILIVTVAGQGVVNQYGDMIFKAVDGNEYKISNKRPQYFGAIQPGRTVKLSYAEYKNQEYIAEVATAEPQTTASNNTTAQKQPTQPSPKYNSSNQSVNAPISGAEKGMIIKEVGDSFRAGLFQTKDQPDLWTFYKGELSRVTGVKIN